MSAIGISSPSVTQSVGDNATVQLHRDEQKLVADTKAKASQTQIAADNLAIATDKLAIAAQVSTSKVDVYL